MPFDVSINDDAIHPIITLRDAETNTSAEIYSIGALLNRFCKVHDGYEMNIIEGFEGIEDMKANITPAFRSAKLSPFVCRIQNARYHFGEADHNLTKYVAGESALHGLVYDQLFSIVETSANDDQALVRLQYLYNNPAEGYPFTYRCEIEYILTKDHTLSVKSTIYNIDDQLIPIADGWHPYFTLGDPIDECQLEFQSKEMLEFTPGLVPTGKLIPYQEFGSLKDFGTTWFDNCFTVNFAECQPMCVLRNPKRKIQVEIHPSTSYPYLQIFTPPHRNSIAIENLSGAPDAFNNFIGLHVLEPKQSITFSTKFVIKSL